MRIFHLKLRCRCPHWQLLQFAYRIWVKNQNTFTHDLSKHCMCARVSVCACVCVCAAAAAGFGCPLWHLRAAIALGRKMLMLLPESPKINPLLVGPKQHLGWLLINAYACHYVRECVCACVCVLYNLEQHSVI